MNLQFILDHLYVLGYFAIFFPMAAAFVGYYIGKKNKSARDAFVYLVSGVELSPLCFLFVMALKGISVAPVRMPGICGMEMSLEVSGFHALYGMVAAFMWFMTTVFSKQYFEHYRNRNRYYFFLLVTLGATEGVFFSADFFTAFVFFEIMSLTSYVWVAHDEKRDSLRAAETYLGVAVIGGLVMLMGLFLLYDLTLGDLSFESVRALLFAKAAHMDQAEQTKLWAAGFCLLFGFGAKAGAFPLHIWLPKAHPVAPAPASALLSGILTKAGVFGIMLLSSCLFCGNDMWGMIILNLGVATMVAGAVLALFSVDIKRTLACSSVSQIGFILVGVGMAVFTEWENALAVRGSILHMVNHSLIKLTLFMAAGVIYMNVHELDLNAIRGFGRKKPLLNYIFLMGALGIGGVPLWNGYVSKTLIHESIVEYQKMMRTADLVTSDLLTPGYLKGVEWAFLISGGLTVAYMAKLYAAVFLEKNSDAAVQRRYDAMSGKYMNTPSAVVLTVSATLLPIFGLLPDLLMGRLADLGQSLWITQERAQVKWFSFENLKGALVSLTIGAMVYFLIVRPWMMTRKKGRTVYVNRWHKYLDLENLVYRPILLKVLPFVCGVICRVLDSLVDTIVVLLRKTVYRDSKLPVELEEGTIMTHLAGSALNWLEEVGNRTFWKEKPRKVDYEHKLALFYEDLRENRIIIARSLSFGLLLFCMGLILTVAYLLVVH